jgi:hypothetical protein
MHNQSFLPDITFCSIIQPGNYNEIDALLLAESFRAFAGSYANAPIWFMLPRNGKDLTERTHSRLQELKIRLVPFEYEPGAEKIFFLLELAALAQIEKLADGQTHLLAWLDSNTIILNEPRDLLLQKTKNLAYKPVHLLLLGSDYGQPVDPFWQQIFHYCQVPQEHLFPMRPIVQEIRMRPYFNAGLLIIRPEQGLLRSWNSKFMELYQLPIFQNFYQKDPRYKIFMHQAVLAGTILNLFYPGELVELPDGYNYPLHLWQEDKTIRRPESLNEAITIRHEGFYLENGWETQIPLSAQRIQWLVNTLKQFDIKMSGNQVVDQ